eukprot:TRINITY_DN121873_c0_g1_i1.p1 TRINITY_DN121873_c0_g1~~TRINITY_DN121873_c0_g1_i1.p1  ORF type:complete len:793 (+),score=178.71 TRINITY_DN121873_c0_g1_i1:103-2481(+)
MVWTRHSRATSPHGGPVTAPSFGWGAAQEEARGPVVASNHPWLRWVPTSATVVPEALDDRQLLGNSSYEPLIHRFAEFAHESLPHSARWNRDAVHTFSPAHSTRAGRPSPSASSWHMVRSRFDYVPSPAASMPLGHRPDPWGRSDWPGSSSSWQSSSRPVKSQELEAGLYLMEQNRLLCGRVQDLEAELETMKVENEQQRLQRRNDELEAKVQNLEMECKLLKQAKRWLPTPGGANMSPREPVEELEAAMASRLAALEQECGVLRQMYTPKGHHVSLGGWEQPPPGGASEVRGRRRPEAEKAVRSTVPEAIDLADCIDWKKADPSKWQYLSVQYSGGYHFHRQTKFDRATGSTEEGIAKLKKNPAQYESIFFQTNLHNKYVLVHRNGSGFGVDELKDGPFTCITAKYQALSPNVKIQADVYTDRMTRSGKALGKPVSPGRGQGCADVPGLKLMGHASPGDVSQGSVGDCWLLSAISALAEFDGAIAKLFKNTKDLKNLPHDGANEYVVTLYDLKTWQPIDVVVDERLCTKPNSNSLLGAAPSASGELWVCYLEKAIVAHCGGWDEVDGGVCTHAWRLLTGCRDQYTFHWRDGGFRCSGTKNPNTGQWEELANSPHKGFRALWPMPWPEVSGGGSLGSKVSEENLFERMCAWDDHNFLIACASKGSSDKNDSDGIVDGHAYTVLQCIDNAGGTEFDMVKIRNPWGHGELKSGKWDDDGPGWAAYPSVKAACKPRASDDGTFWMERAEFFKYFDTVYLCALDMAEFVKRSDAAGSKKTGCSKSFFSNVKDLFHF